MPQDHKISVNPAQQHRRTKTDEKACLIVNYMLSKHRFITYMHNFNESTSKFCIDG
jgi:hypothetical protein